MIALSDRRGFMRDLTFLLALVLCLLVVYLLARGEAADMVAAFIRRVRAMGQP